MIEAMSDDEAAGCARRNRNRIMTIQPAGRAEPSALDPSLSLFQLLDPQVHADPYPFYRHLREQAPVHWDPFMHTWVVTRYEDVHDGAARLLGRPHARSGARCEARPARARPDRRHHVAADAVP